MVANFSLSGSGRKVWWGGRLFEAGRLLPFSAFRMGAYSRWALNRGWALIRINTVFVANLKIALGVIPFVSNGGPRLNVPSLLERGLNMHFSPKIRQILPPCDNCDIKNGRKQVKKFGQP